jgi:large subunit ribosomal protein L29
MTMKARELADLDTDELAAKLAEAKEELFNLRFQNVTGQLDDPHRLREVRKDIARIFTVIRQRELAGEAVPASAPAAGRQGGRRRFGRRNERS